MIALFSLIVSSFIGNGTIILIVIAAILAVLTSFHQIASGVMEEDGVCVKRYLRWMKLPWTAIEGITRSPMGTILITIKGHGLLKGRYSLILNPVIFGVPQGYASFEDLRTAWLVSQGHRPFRGISPN